MGFTDLHTPCACSSLSSRVREAVQDPQAPAGAQAAFGNNWAQMHQLLVATVIMMCLRCRNYCHLLTLVNKAAEPETLQCSSPGLVLSHRRLRLPHCRGGLRTSPLAAQYLHPLPLLL